jgi:RNA polymerase sigma factor (sigma-70 family)
MLTVNSFEETMEQSDQQLLKACQRGDETAWETLINRYQRLIYTIPRRAGLDEDQAADIFQEVFTTLFEKLDGIEQPERLQAWLVTTARRKTWRQIVKAKESRHGADPDTEEDELANLPDGAALPDEVLESLEEQHSVRAAVAALDERCHKLIRLLFYAAEPSSYADIATALGTSAGSIGPTRARCLEKLLVLLKD